MALRICIKYYRHEQVAAVIKETDAAFLIFLQIKKRRGGRINFYIWDWPVLPLLLRGELTLSIAHDKMKKLFALHENYIAN